MFLCVRTKPADKKPPPPTRRISRGNSVAHRGSSNMANGVRGLEISSPLPADGSAGSDNAHMSLLPKPGGNSDLNPTFNPSSSVSTDGSTPSLHNNFFGQFKGFSITPLPSNNSSPSKFPSLPSRSQPVPGSVAPSVPSVHVKSPKSSNNPAWTNNTVGSTELSSTKVSSASYSANTTATSTAPALPPANVPSVTARPFISNPVLDATTCTAKELISSIPSVPSRPAPDIPTNSVKAAGSTVFSGSSSKPTRPLSSPNSLAIGAFSPQTLEDKKTKDSGSSYPTLTRLASFMMRQNSGGVARSQSQNQGSAQSNEKIKGKDKNKTMGSGTNSLPRTHHHGVKANKLQIDKEALRNLQISNPIPQQDIDIPQSVVPVRPAPSPPSPPPSIDSSKQVVMRAQSLRDKGPLTQRPSIPTFGSMRQPSGTKRPTSIPAGARPTSPPPPRPPPPPSKSEELATGIIGLPGYQNPPTVNPVEYSYDDCLNLLSDATAPLANIDEESSPNSGDNIYAVIEESPLGSSRKKIGQSFSPPSEYAAPVPPKSSTASDNHNLNSKFEYTSPSFNEYKSPKPVENSISAGSLESVGLLSEIVNEIQARNMESIYSTSTLRRKQDTKMNTSDIDDVSSAITATDSSVAGSASPQLSRDKSSALASSNSSLGTYVNANIYHPGASVYSNLSTQTNPASSPHLPSVNSSSSSSSSSSGYLSPKPQTTTQSSLVNNTSNTSMSKDFSTFRSPLQTTDISTTPRTAVAATPITKLVSVDIKKMPSVTSPQTSTLPGDVSTYKPYSSTLQRSLGPLAASFRGSSSLTMSSAIRDTKTNNMSSEISKQPISQNAVPAVPNRNTVAKVASGSLSAAVSLDASRNDKNITSVTTKPSTTSTPAPPSQPARPTLHRTPTPPSLSAKTSVSGSSSSAKPVSSITKTPVTATVNSSALHRGKALNAGVRGDTSPANNSPDVVSSCSVAGSGNSGRSPDIVGDGKADTKISLKTPDVIAANTMVKPLPNLPTRSTVPSGINRSASNVGSGAAKSTVGTGSRISSVQSSFKGSQAVKQPQLTPKPSVLRSGASTATGNVSQQDKTRAGAAGLKDASSKVTGGGRGTTVTKSASDVTGSGNKSMAAAARAAASKLSHVASLQQKFETVAASDKGGASVGRTSSSAANKMRAPSSVVGAKAATVDLSTSRNAGSKK